MPAGFPTARPSDGSEVTNPDVASVYGVPVGDTREGKSMTKHICFAAALLGCGVLAAACGDSGPTSQPAPPASQPAATATATPAAAASQETRLVATQHRPQRDIRLEAAIDLGQTPGAASPELRHGIEATTADWPASLYVTFPTPDGTAACTATLVGPRAMLTAAHCVPEKGKVSFV